MKELTCYRVNANDFFAGVSASLPDAFVRTPMVEKCRKSMQGIINRYSLSKKNILSLGCGNAFEEYWFHEAGCPLILNELDLPEEAAECGPNEEYLKSLSNESIKDLQFFIGDAGDLVSRNQISTKVDCLYVSSFHPDEIRREKIQQDFINNRNELEASNYITWPQDKKAYLDLLVEATKYLQQGGIVIFQHYRGGVDVSRNPNYLKCVGKQFENFGIRLLEVYSFRRSAQHLLVVGYKGTKNEALNFRKSISETNQIEEFHGRYPDASIRTEVEKAFDILDPKVSARPWPPPPSHFRRYGGWVKRRIRNFLTNT